MEKGGETEILCVPDCTECTKREPPQKNRLEIRVFEIETEKTDDTKFKLPFFMPVNFCPVCDEYKCRNESFPVAKEDDAVKYAYNLAYAIVRVAFGAVKGYKRIEIR